MTFINVLLVCLEDGFMYGLLAIGYYITYTILDFPDLSAEGSVVSGAIAYALLANIGVPPVVAMIASALVGAVCGFIVGILHVKLHIKPLLCGILVSTALISVNIAAMILGTGGDFAGQNGMSSIIVRPTIIPYFLPANVRKAVAFFIILLVVKFITDMYLRTKNGMLLFATGDNATFTTMLGKDPGNSKIIGLSIGGALYAVTGSLIAQRAQNATTSMGLGMVVMGIASVIIGLSVFKKVKRIKPTTKVVLGSIIYQICLGIAVAVGLPTNYNKLLMAILFTLALILSKKVYKKGGARNADTE